MVSIEYEISLLFFVTLELPTGKKTQNDLQSVDYQQNCKDYDLHQQHIVLQEYIVNSKDEGNQIHYDEESHMG